MGNSAAETQSTAGLLKACAGTKPSTPSRANQATMQERSQVRMGRSALRCDFDLRLDLLTQADVQFAQLLLVDRRRGIGEQALGALGLREGNHVADRFGTGHHGDDAIQAEGKATVRGRTVLQ